MTTQALQVTDHMIKRVVEFRTSGLRVQKQLNQTIFDVAYTNLMRQPILTVRKIYQHSGLSWSDEFETNMYQWLRENYQGKQDRYAYCLEEIGLIREATEERYRDSVNMFPAARTKMKAHSDEVYHDEHIFLTENYHLEV